MCAHVNVNKSQWLLLIILWIPFFQGGCSSCKFLRNVTCIPVLKRAKSQNCLCHWQTLVNGVQDKPPQFAWGKVMRISEELCWKRTAFASAGSSSLLWCSPQTEALCVKHLDSFAFFFHLKQRHESQLVGEEPQELFGPLDVFTVAF